MQTQTLSSLQPTSSYFPFFFALIQSNGHQHNSNIHAKAEISVKTGKSKHRTATNQPPMDRISSPPPDLTNRVPSINPTIRLCLLRKHPHMPPQEHILALLQPPGDIRIYTSCHKSRRFEVISKRTKGHHYPIFIKMFVICLSSSVASRIEHCARAKFISVSASQASFV